MKNQGGNLLSGISCLFLLHFATASAATPAALPPEFDAAAWSIQSRSAHENAWQGVVRTTDSETGEITRHVQEFVELGVGLNYLDEKGEWQPSRPEWEVTPEGVALIEANGEWRVLFVEDRSEAIGYGTRNAIHWPVSILGAVE
jgi:hypothetical protein